MNSGSDIPKLCAIRKPAFTNTKGDRKFMTTLLPSFNEKETWKNTEIQTSLDCQLTGVKRLASLDPSFFISNNLCFVNIRNNKLIRNEELRCKHV